MHADGNDQPLGATIDAHWQSMFAHVQVAWGAAAAEGSWWHAGVLTGTGRQLVGAWVAFGAYWCCGIPLALLLAFKLGWGVQGLWTALLVASGLVCLADSAFLGRLNWSKEADRIQDGMEREQGGAEAHGGGQDEEPGCRTKLLGSDGSDRTSV